MLEKKATVYPRLHRFSCRKIIVYTMFFSWSWRARSMTNTETKYGREITQQFTDKCPFANPTRANYDKAGGPSPNPMLEVVSANTSDVLRPLKK